MASPIDTKKTFDETSVVHKDVQQKGKANSKEVHATPPLPMCNSDVSSSHPKTKNLHDRVITIRLQSELVEPFLKDIEEKLTRENSEKKELLTICEKLEKKKPDECEHYRKKSSMFDSLFHFKVPEETPDDLNVKGFLTVKDMGKSVLSDENRELERLSILIHKYIIESQFYTPIDKTKATYIRKELRKIGCHKILEIGAGAGWFAAALSHNGNRSKGIPATTVTATDSNKEIKDNTIAILEETTTKAKSRHKEQQPSCSSSQSYQTVNLNFPSVHQIEEIDADASIKKYAESHDILLVTSPKGDVFKAIKEWPSEKPVLYIDEDKFRKTAEKMKLKVSIEPVKSNLNSLLICDSWGGRVYLTEIFKAKFLG